MDFEWTDLILIEIGSVVESLMHELRHVPGAKPYVLARAPNFGR